MRRAKSEDLKDEKSCFLRSSQSLDSFTKISKTEKNSIERSEEIEDLTSATTISSSTGESSVRLEISDTDQDESDEASQKKSVSSDSSAMDDLNIPSEEHPSLSIPDTPTEDVYAFANYMKEHDCLFLNSNIFKNSHL